MTESARYVLGIRRVDNGFAYKQAQMIAQMTAGRRFWHKPKSATVGTAQTKLAECYDLCESEQSNTEEQTRISLGSPSSHN